VEDFAKLTQAADEKNKPIVKDLWKSFSIREFIAA
jgi:hypothetical protein